MNTIDNNMDMLNLLFGEGVKSVFKDELKEIVKEALREMAQENQGTIQPTVDTVLLDRKEAAKILNISLPTLDYYSKEGIITGRRIGKKILYRKDELITAGKSVAINKYKRRVDY